MDEVLKELQELKQLAVLGAKTALTMNDVVLLTGLSKSHLYKLVWSKKIPYYKSDGGKMTYFNKQEIEDWLLAYRVPTEDEHKQKVLDDCATNKPKKGARNV